MLLDGASRPAAHLASRAVVLGHAAHVVYGFSVTLGVFCALGAEAPGHLLVGAEIASGQDDAFAGLEQLAGPALVFGDRAGDGSAAALSADDAFMAAAPSRPEILCGLAADSADFGEAADVGKPLLADGHLASRFYGLDGGCPGFTAADSNRAIGAIRLAVGDLDAPSWAAAKAAWAPASPPPATATSKARDSAISSSPTAGAAPSRSGSRMYPAGRELPVSARSGLLAAGAAGWLALGAHPARPSAMPASPNPVAPLIGPLLAMLAPSSFSLLAMSREKGYGSAWRGARCGDGSL